MKQTQIGQVMPVLLLVVLAVLVVAIVSYNSSRATVSKMELINAADAAAYSGALQTARSMNFMAYTSRGMVANTVGAGYLVSYVSHLRHLAASIDELSQPKKLLAKVASFAAGSAKKQIEGLTDFAVEDTDQNIDDPMLEMLLDPDAPRSDDPMYQPDADQEAQFEAEANQANTANQSFAGNKFQRAGRFGGAVLDKVATTIGYGTIPLTDLLNTAYAGIQMAEYAALNNAITGTMTQVAEGYGKDIVLDDDNAMDVYAWMLPIRPGLDGFPVSIPKTFNFNVGGHIKKRAVSTGNPIGGIAGIVSGLALSALGSKDIEMKRNLSLGVMERLIINSIPFYDDERFMVWERAWRACFQLVGKAPVPLLPIPLNPGAPRLDVYVTPPCTPPFVPPAFPGMAQIAIDKTGGSNLTFARESGSESGREIMEKRRKESPNGDGIWNDGPSDSESNSSSPTGGGMWNDDGGGSAVNNSGTQLTGDQLWNQGLDDTTGVILDVHGTEVTSGTIQEQADRPENRARRSGNQTDREYSDLSEQSPMRQAVKNTQNAVIDQFRSRLYGSSLGKKSGISGLASTLARGASWGADWQAEDKIEIGAFVWRPKFQALPPFININDTLFDSGFDLEGNELAWGGATAKEFWPTYQGVPLYMALAEIPWTDGVSFGLDSRKNGRVIDVALLRPVANSQLNIGFMDAPDDIEFQAKARGEVFYYRQPHDTDNPSEKGFGGESYGYFPTPGVADSPLMSPFAAFAASLLVGGEETWFNLMKNWYGQKWANTQIAIPMFIHLMKPGLGIDKEFPNLLTPFWDARLADI